MKFIKPSTIFFITMALLMSCKKENEKKTVQKETKSTITIEKLSNSPAYKNAVLALKKPNDTENIQGGTVDFDFEVSIDYKDLEDNISDNKGDIEKSILSAVTFIICG